MSCTAIMTTEPPTIPADETVARATAMLIQHRYTSLAVVDAAGCFVGMFGIRDLFGLLVPRVALAGDFISNLRFISGDAGELRRRFEELKNRCVFEVADHNVPRLAPEESEIEAIRLCCSSQTPIPVVEKDTNTLIGIVSFWEVIGALASAR